MIEQHRYVKLRDENADSAGRDAIAREAERLLAAVPGVQAVTVGVPADEPAARAWDIAIRLRLETRRDLDALAGRPEYRRFVDEFLAPRAEVMKVWSFAVRAPGGEPAGEDAARR